MLKNIIINESQKIFTEQVEIRREIHKNPELGFGEYKTAALIGNFLSDTGIPFTANIAKTGVMGIIKGAKPGRTLLIRADMDALDLSEDSVAPYKSQNEGKMHGCGHDAHVAILLGTAKILNKIKSELSGNVMLIFQPAEEGMGGALPMINEGIFDEIVPQACIAAHVSPTLPTGQIMVKKGPVTASPDEFEIIIRGKGGHAALPQNTISPILIGGEVISSLKNSIVSKLPQGTKIILSIGYFHAGSSSPNIIPEFGVIGGTYRTIESSIREQIPKLIETTLDDIVKRAGANYEINYKKLYPPTVNDTQVTEMLAKSASDVIGHENVVWYDEVAMIGEDFAYFAQKAPSVFFNLGCGNKIKNIIYPLHSSKFDLDEDCIKIGTQIMCQFAIDYLK